MTRVFMPTENVFNAVDAVVSDGYAAVEGTKRMAVPYCEKIIAELEPYENILPVTSYQDVTNRGYLYLVVDANRFPVVGDELRDLIDELDRNDPE
ncbi:hypothetical protein Acife_0344 [Acidithiobacillus ferrivorans SS3]|uniref:Uncharacterized protein n=2 Tax=Acidithiobacillus ferrivorans TaxID=160808 RepID=G0JSL5_9PROT|nr:hypothetical protein Acife_0344 [Acidithiobacillus ferrivorans SS3]OFA17174.1 hypothetical protein A4U49_03475 [Acidithiobacillus ferrivorans]